MKTKRVHKLQLSRETVRQLESGRLAAAVGGKSYPNDCVTAYPPSCPNDCYTNDCTIGCTLAPPSCPNDCVTNPPC